NLPGTQLAGLRAGNELAENVCEHGGPPSIVLNECTLTVHMNRPAPETASIAAGAASALGASVCCVLPLVLVAIGVGGAWVAQLRALERFYPVFVGLAIAAFAYAFYRLYLKAVPCASPACSRQRRISRRRARRRATTPTRCRPRRSRKR